MQFTPEKLLEENQKTIQAIDDYKLALQSGDETKAEAGKVYMLQLLEGLVVRDANKYKGHESFDDLLQIGRMAILEHLDNYNPRQTMPSTYFEIHINSALQKTCYKNAYSNLSQHYATQIRRINRICEGNGLIPEETDATMIAELSKSTKHPMSIKTIVKCKELMTCSVSSFEELEDYTSDDDFNTSPEKLYEKQELTETLKSILDTFEPFDRYLMQLFYISDDKEPSVNEVVEYLNGLDEDAKAFLGIAGRIVTSNYITTHRENAKKRMKKMYFETIDKEVKSMEREEIRLTTVDTVTEDDIQNLNDITIILDDIE